MFKKKKKNEEVETKSMWDDKNAVDLHYLQMKADINESQHIQKVVDNGEYIRTSQDIEKYVRELEIRHGFDEMMGNPMESIERLFDD